MQGRRSHWGTLALSAALAGCGGGDSSTADLLRMLSAQNASATPAADREPVIQAGTEEIVEILSDEQLVGEERYEYREISQSGVLSATALRAAEGTGLYYPVLTQAVYSEWKPIRPGSVSAGNVAAAGVPLVSGPQPQPEAPAFFTALWHALQAHHGGKLSPQELLAQVDDLDATLETLYADFSASGLSLQDYVGLYELLDTYFSDELDELQFRTFLQQSRMTPADFLARLQTQGLTPAGFLAGLKKSGQGTRGLQTYYTSQFEPGAQNAQELQSDPFEGYSFLKEFNRSFSGDAIWQRIPRYSFNAYSLFVGPVINLADAAIYGLSIAFKYVLGTYHVQPFAWTTDIAGTQGGYVLNSNEVHYRGKILGVTTYEFKVQGVATVGARSALFPNSELVKDLRISVRDAKARPANAWAMAFEAQSVLAPPSVEVDKEELPNDDHVVLLVGGAVIKTGVKTKKLVFTSPVAGKMPPESTLTLAVGSP